VSETSREADILTIRTAFKACQYAVFLKKFLEYIEFQHMKCKYVQQRSQVYLSRW